MAHFLDTLPFDHSRPEAHVLVNLLADHFYSERMFIKLVRETQNLRPADFNLQGDMRTVWHEALTTARARGKLRALLRTAQKQPEAEGGLATRLEELLGAQPAVPAPPPAPLQWQGEPERILGVRNTLLDIAFLQKGLEVATAVCRLLVTAPNGDRYDGTGFRIGADLVLTNHHVLFYGDAPAVKAELWFDHERSFGGAHRAVTRIEGDVGSIIGRADHDWAVIRTPTALPERYRILSLGSTRRVAVDDRVYIVQHPEGGPKAIGMHHNIVRYVGPDRVQYHTDTQGGSSGSPVFDDRWEIVALHHSAVSTRSEHRNQGIRIERVIDGLAAEGITLG